MLRYHEIAADERRVLSLTSLIQRSLPILFRALRTASTSTWKSKQSMGMNELDVAMFPIGIAFFPP
jgi:hypothetical protein